jgi:hypothetical protein
MRQQVLVTQVDIQRVGQVCYFQVILPASAKRIIGIEASSGIRQMSMSDRHAYSFPYPWTGMPKFIYFMRSVQYGELKLQSQGKENIFYAKHVQSDESIPSGDYSAHEGWVPAPYTHQAKSEEDSISIDTCGKVIHGIYTDVIGRKIGYDVMYTVTVYVWIDTGKGEET